MHSGRLLPWVCRTTSGGIAAPSPLPLPDFFCPSMPPMLTGTGLCPRPHPMIRTRGQRAMPNRPFHTRSYAKSTGIRFSSRHRTACTRSQSSGCPCHGPSLPPRGQQAWLPRAVETGTRREIAMRAGFRILPAMPSPSLSRSRTSSAAAFKISLILVGHIAHWQVPCRENIRRHCRTWQQDCGNELHQTGTSSLLLPHQIRICANLVAALAFAQPQSSSLSPAFPSPIPSNSTARTASRCSPWSNSRANDGCSGSRPRR